MAGLGERLPVLLADDGQAHPPAAVHVGVVDPGCERHCRRLEWILLREADAQVEGLEVVGRFLLCKRGIELCAEARRLIFLLGPGSGFPLSPAPPQGLRHPLLHS